MNLAKFSYIHWTRLKQNNKFNHMLYKIKDFNEK